MGILNVVEEIYAGGLTVLTMNCAKELYYLVCLLLRRLGTAASLERAVFSLHELAHRLDGSLVSAQYVPLFSLLRAPTLPTIQTKLAELATAEGDAAGGMDAAQHLAASLQPHNSIKACLTGMLPFVQPQWDEFLDQVHVARLLSRKIPISCSTCVG